MALFKPFRGSRVSLDAQPLHDGYAYFCTDDGTFHIDHIDSDGNLQRKQINEDFIKQLLNITDDIGYIDAGAIINEEVDVNG
mgnify:CR=1 FL=1